MNKPSLFVVNLENLTIEQIEDFCGMKALPDNRVKEGPRVDYKKAGFDFWPMLRRTDLT